MTGLEKGKALFQKQEFKKAIDALTLFLAEQNNNADALYTRALCYRKIEAYEKSVEDLSSILVRLPNEATLLCERAISHFNNKDIDAALKDMDKAVEIEPDNPFRYSSRAYIKSETDPKGAMVDYEKAIALDPKDEISLNNLGLLQENLGQLKAAKETFKKSNKIIGYDPEKRQETKINETADIKKEASLGKVMLSVFKSKKARQEYFNFLKSFFKK